MTKRRLLLYIFAAVLIVLVVAAIIYTQSYYHADQKAAAALESDSTVAVSETDYGWFFDGPSDENALIFYPGGKVEETAYAKLLHELSRDGINVCLVKMPARLAVLDKDKAEDVHLQYSYDNWYIGGHSLGGAMAATYLGKHPDAYKGLILLAAYQTKPLDSKLKVLAIYGSKDTVLDTEKVKTGQTLSPAQQTTVVIEGGNHAQFGDYGEQKGDGQAAISPAEQQEETCDAITDFILTLR